MPTHWKWNHLSHASHPKPGTTKLTYFLWQSNQRISGGCCCCLQQPLSVRRENNWSQLRPFHWKRKLHGSGPLHDHPMSNTSLPRRSAIIMPNNQKGHGFKGLLTRTTLFQKQLWNGTLDHLSDLSLRTRRYSLYQSSRHLANRSFQSSIVSINLFRQ